MGGLILPPSAQLYSLRTGPYWHLFLVCAFVRLEEISRSEFGRESSKLSVGDGTLLLCLGAASTLMLGYHGMPATSLSPRCKQRMNVSFCSWFQSSIFMVGNMVEHLHHSRQKQSRAAAKCSQNTATKSQPHQPASNQALFFYAYQHYIQWIVMIGLHCEVNLFKFGSTNDKLFLKPEPSWSLKMPS